MYCLIYFLKKYLFLWLCCVLAVALTISLVACGIESGPSALEVQTLSYWTTRGVPPSYSSLGVKFSGIKCIHNIGQPSPLSIFSTFSSSQRETLDPFENNSPSPSPGPPPTPTLMWSFFVWLILLSIMLSGIIHIVACISTLFLLIAE